MYFMISKDENRRIELDFSNKKGNVRTVSERLPPEEYDYYKWAKTEDFARNELAKARKKLGLNIQLFTLREDKFLLCVNEKPAAYLSEEEIEEQRQISEGAFLEQMLFLLPTYKK